jgi:hypothetical protein
MRVKAIENYSPFFAIISPYNQEYLDREILKQPNGTISDIKIPIKINMNGVTVKEYDINKIVNKLNSELALKEQIWINKKKL